MAEIYLSADTGRDLGRVTRADLRMATGRHTLAFLTTTPRRPRLSVRTALPEGSPVTLTWGRRPDALATWYGYVNHREQSGSDRTRLDESTYVLVGTSAVLDTQRTRSWAATSVSDVVRSIATDHGLRSFVTRTGDPQHIAQAAESDFALLRRLAAQNGRRFWCDGSTLYFTGMDAYLVGPSTAVPLFRRDGRAADTVLAIEMVKGPSVRSDSVQAVRTTYGIDRASGRLVRATTVPAGPAAMADRIELGAPVGSYVQAARRLDAVADNNSRWIYADATLAGNTRVVPGAMIQLAGGRLPDGAAGEWTVDSAEHEITLALPGNPLHTRFRTRARLLRNAETGVAATTVRLAPDRERADCALDGTGRWRSTIIREVTL